MWIGIKAAAQLRNWNLSPTEAAALQRELVSRVLQQPVDISINKFSEIVYVGIVVLKFPYIPGLLSFREIPPLLKRGESSKTCRIPEPTRQAHLFVNELRLGDLAIWPGNKLPG